VEEMKKCLPFCTIQRQPEKAVNFYAKDLQDFQTSRDELGKWKVLMKTLATDDKDTSSIFTIFQ